MFFRALAVNLLAIILGCSLAIAVINSHSYAKNAVAQKTVAQKTVAQKTVAQKTVAQKTKVNQANNKQTITTENNNYKFPGIEQNKNHPILKKDYALQKFNKKSQEFEPVNPDELIALYKKQDHQQKLAEEKKFKASMYQRNQNALKRYAQKKKQVAEIEKKYAKELDELTVNSSDIKSLSLDE